MTTLQRSIVLLFDRPSDADAADIAANSSEQHFNSRDCTWHFSDVLPEGVPVDSADQLSAYKRDAGPGAIYLVIEKE